HHDDQQRPQGVRHRDRAGAGVDPAERDRDRSRHVADRVQRHLRLRHRLGDRGLPLPPRHPGARAQRPALQERRLMAVRAEPIVIPRPGDSVAAKTLRVLAKTPLQILLAAIGLLWLVPTIGLFVTSIVPQSAITTEGWWKIFAHPSLATFSNYRALFHSAGLTGALKTTAYIAVGNTVLVVVV